MMMSLRRLRYFGILARELHFGRAAEALGITQSALSQQIKTPEQEVGVTLVVGRGVKGVGLTKAGDALAEGSAQVLLLCDELSERMRFVASGRAGTLAVAYSLHGALLGQRDTVERFRKIMPDITIDAESGCTARNLDRLESGEVDVAFTRETHRCGEIESVVLAEEPLVAVLPRDHRLVTCPELQRQHLRDESVVMWPPRLSPALYDRILDQVWGASVPSITREEPDADSICMAVEEGKAIAVLDSRIAQRHAGSRLIVRGFTGAAPTTTISVAWRKANSEPMVDKFVALTQRDYVAASQAGS